MVVLGGADGWRHGETFTSGHTVGVDAPAHAGSWELRVYAGVDARSGKVRYRTRTVHGTRTAARRALAELVDTVQYGPSFGAEAPLSVLLDPWLAAKESIWSAGTLGETRSIIRHHLLPRLEAVPVGAITTVQIDGLLADVRRTRSAGTVNRVRGVLHAALAQAVRWEWIWSNPASNATRYEAGPRRHDVPPPDTVIKVLDWLKASDPVLMLFVRLAATTGARRGEILGLCWDDVDLVAGRVRLVRGLIDATGVRCCRNARRRTRTASTSTPKPSSC